MIGPITWAGSQWRQVCQLARLDPSATAAEVAAALRQSAPLNHDLLRAERDVLSIEVERLRAALDAARQQLPLGV